MKKIPNRRIKEVTLGCGHSITVAHYKRVPTVGTLCSSCYEAQPHKQNAGKPEAGAPKSAGYFLEGSNDLPQSLVARPLTERLAARIAKVKPADTQGFRALDMKLHQQSIDQVEELLSALEKAYMALIGYLPGHRNDVTDAAIEAARAAILKATK